MCQWYNENMFFLSGTTLKFLITQNPKTKSSFENLWEWKVNVWASKWLKNERFRDFPRAALLEVVGWGVQNGIELGKLMKNENISKVHTPNKYSIYKPRKWLCSCGRVWWWELAGGSSSSKAPPWAGHRHLLFDLKYKKNDDDGPTTRDALFFLCMFFCPFIQLFVRSLKKGSHFVFLGLSGNFGPF